MKKIVVLLMTLFTVVVCASAQKGEMGVGGQLLYGDDSDIGIGARFQYNILDQLRFAPSMNLFFPDNSDVTWFELNADIHYLFPVVDKLKLYPLGGLNLTRVSYKDNSDTELGLNIGGGAQYGVFSNLDLIGELKYVTGDADQLVISAGVVFKF